MTDSVKLWDFRQEKSVMQLLGHVNRHARLNSKMSPCGNYLSTGSEDNHAYIYDIRTKLVAGKTGGNHGDTVSCVEYNPSTGELLTGAYDGKIRTFQ